MECVINALYEQIISERKDGKSIAEIAKKLHTTQVRVQRVLITEGLWTSKRTRQIAEMRMQGMTIPEIAELLGKDENTIQTFLPYSRGLYGRNETIESVKSKDYRDRMQTAATNMVKEESEMQSLLDNRKQSVLHDYNVHLKKFRDRALELQKDPFLSDKSVYRVKFELCEGFYYGASSDMGLEEEESEELLKYAKAESGITREVLIPGDMNLHALHYMIQSLFGWQNSHLHHFSISQDAFAQMTEGRFDKWTELCGKLFRFSTDDMEDLYWDDDYEPGISVKSWLKSKYKAPYVQKAYADSMEGNLEGIADFRKRFPNIPMDITLEDLNSRVVFEEDYNTLLEGLTLHELLPVFKDLYYLYDYGDDWCVHISMIDKYDRKTNADLQPSVAGGWFVPDIMNEKDGLSKYRYFIDDGENNTQKELEKQAAEKGAPKKEYATTTAGEVNDISGLFDAVDNRQQFECEVEEELRAQLAVVDVKKMPICTKADGLNVMDDVGGISGLLDFYRIINGDDPDEKAEMREWARGLGWTGRMSKPEKMV